MAFTPYSSDKGGTASCSPPKLGPLAYTKEWFAIRRHTIGASEAAGVCGMSRYTQPLEIYNNKVGGSEPEEQSREQRRGHIFESAVLQLYEDKAGGTLFTECPMLVHPKWDFMAATPDALWTSDKINLDNSGWSYHVDYIPVDAKTTMHWQDFGEEGTDDVPQEYVFQAQQQMAVTGASRCDMPVYGGRGYDISVYSVIRNDDIIGYIKDAELEMMERIKNSDPPEPNWEHPKTYEVIRKSFSEVVEESVELDEGLQALWDEAAALSKERGRLDTEISQKKAKILFAMGGRSVGILPDGRNLVRKMIKRAARQVSESEYVRLSCRKKR